MEEVITNKEFSKGFTNDIFYLMHECVKNKTDGCTVTLELPNFDLDIQMVFIAKKKKGGQNDQE